MSFARPISSYTDEELTTMRRRLFFGAMFDNGSRLTGEAQADFRAIVDEQARRVLGTSESQFPRALQDEPQDRLPFD